MSRKARVFLVKLCIVVAAAALGAIAAALSAAILSALLGERSMFASEDTIPLAGIGGAMFGACVAAVGWGPLRFAPLGSVLAGTTIGALVGATLAGAIGGVFERQYELGGAFYGAAAGFISAVEVLRRRYRAPPTTMVG